MITTAGANPDFSIVFNLTALESSELAVQVSITLGVTPDADNSLVHL